MARAGRRASHEEPPGPWAKSGRGGVRPAETGLGVRRPAAQALGGQNAYISLIGNLPPQNPFPARRISFNRRSCPGPTVWRRPCLANRSVVPTAIYPATRPQPFYALAEERQGERISTAAGGGVCVLRDVGADQFNWLLPMVLVSSYPAYSHTDSSLQEWFPMVLLPLFPPAKRQADVALQEPYPMRLLPSWSPAM